MDPDKAGDGVRELGEVLGTFPETFVQIKVLETIHFLHWNQTTGSMINGLLGLAFKTPKLTFAGSKRSHILSIISMEKDGVLKKILSLPISKTDTFLQHPVSMALTIKISAPLSWKL